MNLNENNKYEILDDYLSGGMSADDLDKFRAFLQSDADLAMDYQIVTELKEAKEFAPLEADIRATLASIKGGAPSATSPQLAVSHNANPTPISKTSSRRFLYTSIAMAASLLLLVGVFLPNMLDSGDSYAQYAMIEPLNLTTKGTVTDLTLTKTLQEAYNAQDYDQALPQIEAYLAVAPKDMDVLLAKGITLMELNRFDEAHAAFDYIKSLNPRVKKYQWFDAQCYLKQGKLPEAQSLLNDLVASKAYNHKQAQELLATFE